MNAQYTTCTVHVQLLLLPTFMQAATDYTQYIHYYYYYYLININLKKLSNNPHFPHSTNKQQ